MSPAEKSADRPLEKSTEILRAELQRTEEKIEDLQDRAQRLRHALEVLTDLEPSRRARPRWRHAERSRMRGDELSNEMSAVDAAKWVLRKTGRPLPVGQITRRLRHLDYRADTPYKKLRHVVTTSLGREARREDADVYRPERGVYGLVEWKDDDGPELPVARKRIAQTEEE